MKYLISLILAFTLSYPASVSAQDANKNIKLDTGSEIVVEGLRSIMPRRTETALELVPYRWLDKFNDSVKVDSAIASTPSHIYYKEKKHLSSNNLPQNPIFIIDELLDSLAYWGFKAVAFLIVIVLGVKVYDANRLISSSGTQGSKRGEERLKLSFVKTVNYGFVLLYLSPWVVDGGAFTVVMLTVIFTSFFVGSILVTNVGLSLISLVSTEIDESAYENKIDVNLSRLHADIEEVVASKIIHDALLDTSVKEHQFKGGKGVIPASDQALLDIGKAQIDLEKARGLSSFSRKDCLLLDNWSQEAYINPKCAWVLEPSTNNGVMEASLKINYQKPLSYESLTKQEQYIHSKVFALINDEIASFTAHKKAETCVGIHGKTPHILDLENSLFCAKRTGFNYIEQGEFYGYEPTEGGYYTAISEFNTPADRYSFDDFDHELGQVIKGLYEHFALIKLEGVQQEMSEQHNRGLLLAAPTLSSIQNTHRKEYKIAFDDASELVDSYLKNGVYKHILSHHAMHSKRLVNFDGDVDSYLLKYFPYARSVWFDSEYFSGAGSALEYIKSEIPRVDGSNVTGEILASAKKLLSVGAVLVMVDFISSEFGKPLMFVGKAGTFILFLSLFITVAYLMLFFGFFFKLILQHVVLRVLISPILFVLDVIKTLIDDIMNMNKNIEQDLVGMAYIKAEVLNPFIKLVTGVVAWLLGYVMLIPVAYISQRMIAIMPWFVGDSLFTLIFLQVIVFPLVFCVIGYQMCYRLPFILYGYITADIEDPLGDISEDDDTLIGFYRKSKIKNIAS